MKTSQVLSFPSILPKKSIGKKFIPFIARSTGIKPVPRIDIFIESSRFVVKTASTKEERKKAHDLRVKVFVSEFMGAKNAVYSDWDRFDKKSDFLIIVDKKNNDVVGTYRLICSKKPNDFYTSSEFFIDDFVRSPGRKVELSRACVAPAYRKGAVILLLWKGIYSYLEKAQADYLFGCSSLSNVSPADTLSVMRYLQENNFCSDALYSIGIRKSYDCNRHLLSQLSLLNAEKDNKVSLPPLFKSYLKIGAKMIDIPAYDSYYKCYDFFTILRVKDMSNSITRKFSH